LRKFGICAEKRVRLFAHLPAVGSQLRTPLGGARRAAVI
jgi:hypothetical protein